MSLSATKTAGYSSLDRTVLKERSSLVHGQDAAMREFLRARYYHPSNGRFNTLDPFAGSFEEPLSLHKYAYVHNDPVNHFDPAGESILNLLSSLGLFVTTPTAITAGSAIASYASGLLLAQWQLFYGPPVIKELRRFATAVAPFSATLADQARSTAQSLGIQLGIKGAIVGLGPVAFAVSPTGTALYLGYSVYQLVSALHFIDRLLFDGFRVSIGGGISMKAKADFSHLRIAGSILTYQYFPQRDIAAATNILSAIGSAAHNPQAVRSSLSTIVTNIQRIEENARYWANSIEFEVQGPSFRFHLKKVY